MSEIKRTVTYSHFSQLLSQFSDLVKKGTYKKVTYQLWKELMKMESIHSYVTLLFHDSTVTIVSSMMKDLEFPILDKSFGMFLYQEFIECHSDPTSYCSTYTSNDEIYDEYISHKAYISNETYGTYVPHDEGETSKTADIIKCQDKEKDSNMKGFNFDFGPMNANVVRMSIYGLAVKNKTGSWVAYDAKNEEIMDVDVFNFDGSKFMYRMPVAINDVAAGDVIVHMSVPMFVVGKSEDGKAVYAVDPVAGERKEIMLTKSPFGFNFVTKVVNFLGNAFNADASNPFGNLGLMMMLSEDKTGFKDMLPLMLLTNGGNTDNAFGNIANNPLMLYALMSNKDNDIDPLMLMALTGGFNQCAAHNSGCNCGQHTNN